MSLLAIGWEPEIRGLLTVIMAVVVLCGSIYFIMATNMGARLAFLVVLASLFGWMMLMGITWWIYGIGLRGPDPTWAEVPGRTVIQDTTRCIGPGILDVMPEIPEDATYAEEAELVAEQLLAQGYDDPRHVLARVRSGPGAGRRVPRGGRARSSAGQFEIVEVFDIGGDRYPMVNESLDFLAFFHEPHYVLAEAAPLVQVRTEPGRAPVPPTIDENAQRQYVYMVRDLGARRQPAMVLTIGGGAIFLALCYLLHRREKFLRETSPCRRRRCARPAVDDATETSKETVSV